MRHSQVPVGPELFLRNIVRRWQREIHQAERVLVFSPYLTSRTAESVLHTTSGQNCEVYTLFRVEDFASGSSSIHTLRRLLEHGCSLYELADLHAKLVLVPDVFASIGSQNLTNRGAKNREASIVLTDTTILRHLEALLRPWIAERQPITSEMVLEVIAALPPVVRSFRQAQALAASVEEQVRQSEAIRIENRRIVAEANERAAEQRREAARQKLLLRQSRIATARESARVLSGVTKTIAQQFVAASAWWLGHPSGPVRAPRHARRVYGSNGDWRVDFGANTFLVSRAIRRCLHTLDAFLKRIEVNRRVSKEEILGRLRHDVRSSVANFEGFEYGEYPTNGSDMQFGTQSIDIDDFARYFLKSVSAETLLK